jgi:flagellar basal-body rod protein FlgF
VIRGIYTAAAGMTAELHREDVLANNLANASTIGFKSDRTVTTTFQEIFLNAYGKDGVHPIGSLGLGVECGPTYTDYSNGIMTVTDNPTDLALSGDAMFTVETKNGIRYTRSGQFKQDNEGYLVTNDGYRVLGEAGPVNINGGFEVTKNGEIIQDGNVVERLKLVSAAGMEKEGEMLYRGSQTEPATDFQLYQGTLEQSNVNTIREMVQLIEITRNYATNQRALQAQDETLKRAVNDLAK